MNRKGDIMQLPLVVVIIFIVALVGILFLTMTNKVNDFWEKTNLLNNSDNPTAVNAQQKLDRIAPRFTDYAISFLFVGLNLGVIVGAIRTKFSPMLIFFFFLLLLMSIFIASGIVNIYAGITDNDAFATETQQLTLTGIIFSKYFPLFITIIGAITMIVMWSKQGADIVT